MNSLVRTILTVVVLVVVFGLGIGVGMVLTAPLSVEPIAAPADNGSAATTTTGNGGAQFDSALVNEAWRTIDQNYVDRQSITSTQLTYGAISGMTTALGDTGHSRFLSPADLQQQNTQISGEFEGIGVNVNQNEAGQVVVLAPIDDSPAQKAGIKPGDIILKVGDTDLAGMQLNDVVNLILGPAGTTVNITIQQAADGQTRSIDLVRSKITLHPITWRQLPGTNLVQLRISSFNQNVLDELTAALKQINQLNPKGIVLDLRNNPGGLLNQATGTASQFIASGDVLLEKNAQGQITHTAAQSGGLATNTPLVVLINQGSASSAEILAGAIQDHNRGQLVGDTTFGTGTVLNQFNLSDGSALLLAVEEWLTPNGRTIWHKGITPDVAVALAADVAPLYPEEEVDMTAATLQASKDAQLLKAIELLNGTSQTTTTSQISITDMLLNNVKIMAPAAAR